MIPQVAFCGFMSCCQLQAFPKFGALVKFYPTDIVCLIKCFHGKAFPLNSVFLGSVSSLHSCGRDNNYMTDIRPFPSKAEINQKFTSLRGQRKKI